MGSRLESKATVISAILALILALSSAFKALVLNDYRLERLEKAVEKQEQSIETLTIELATIRSQYSAFLAEAKRQGWNLGAWRQPK